MKTNKLKQLDQAGFVPLLLVVFAIVVAGIYLVFTRVMRAQH